MPRITLKNLQQEYELFTQRFVVLSILVVLGAFLLLFRLIQLQVFQHNTYTTLSDQNQLALVPIEPSRGLIYDRNGILLADNTTAYSLELIPERIKNLKTTIEQLRALINIDDDDIKLFYKQLHQLRRFESVPLRMQLNDEEMAQFALNQFRFPGVIIKARLIRHYPYGSSFSHVIGYVGRINPQELEQVDHTNYSASQFIGKVGLEKFYEQRLHGSVGYQQIETDASGRMVRVLKNVPAVSGENLYLTIDAKLQQVAEKLFAEEHGALIAIDPNNGDVLAMVSAPSYDPNLFVKGIDAASYQTLRNAPEKPLYNRAVRGLYAPASTFKPFMALAGLEAGVIDEESKVFDPGWFKLKNSEHIYHDWVIHGHGTVNVIRAITVSCDIFFYELGRKLGISAIDDMMKKFNFGEFTGIEIPEEAKGLIPTPEWKFKRLHTKWYPGDTVITSIGQGFTLVTPLQLASATATIATRGKSYRPHLLRYSENDNSQVKPYELYLRPLVHYSDKTWNLVHQGMQNVVAGAEGTARGHFGQGMPYSTAGKTGTAQVVRKKTTKDVQSQLTKNLRNHSWFIVFAPADHPQIAVAVIVEHNTHGGAATLAREFLDYYFLKKEPNYEVLNNTGTDTH